MYEKFFKRIFDCFCAAISMIILSPVFGIIAVLDWINMGFPFIFKQKRPGKKDRDGQEKIFTLLKFRTMTDARDKNGNVLPDADRLTSFGKALRKTSLDELPQLWNIFVGDMSFVGPRPLLVEDMMFMDERQRERHRIRPGLTGLAQINGRNCTEWTDKLNYDLAYMEKISFCEDIRILLVTIRIVLRHEDITYDKMATAENLGDYLLRIGNISRDEYKLCSDKAKVLLGE